MVILSCSMSNFNEIFVNFDVLCCIFFTFYNQMSSVNMKMLVVAVFSPLLRLSPPPSDRDYCFNLDDTEGVADLFDIASYPV